MRVNLSRLMSLAGLVAAMVALLVGSGASSFASVPTVRTTTASVQAASSCAEKSELSLNLSGISGPMHLTSAGKLAPGAQTASSLCDRPSVVRAAATPAATWGTRYVFKTDLQTGTITDSNGTFTARLYFINNNKNTLQMQYGYSISAQLVAIASGSVSVNVLQTPDNCYWTHASAYPASYGFHWSCATHNGAQGETKGTLKFPVQVSGYVGTATITIDFIFSIAV